MIHGSLDQFSDKDLEALLDAVFSVLEHTGLRIYSEPLLAAVVDSQPQALQTRLRVAGRARQRPPAPGALGRARRHTACA